MRDGHYVVLVAGRTPLPGDVTRGRQRGAVDRGVAGGIGLAIGLRCATVGALMLGACRCWSAEKQGTLLRALRLSELAVTRFCQENYDAIDETLTRIDNGLFDLVRRKYLPEL